MGLLGVTSFGKLDPSYLHAAPLANPAHVFSAFPHLEIAPYQLLDAAVGRITLQRRHPRFRILFGHELYSTSQGRRREVWRKWVI